MIVFNDKKAGFTIIEILLALMIIGIMLPALYVAQGNFLARIGVDTLKLRRIFHAEQFMDSSRLKFEQNPKQRTLTEIIQNPSTKLIYQIKEPSQHLQKRFRDLYAQEVIMEWAEDGIKRKDFLISFIFKPGLKKQ